MTFLLFLKMADEQSRPPFNKPSPVPKEFAWPTLLKPEGEALEARYRCTLQELGARGGVLGTIFRKAQNTRHQLTWFQYAQARLSSMPAFA